jgi:hypothetical protein
MYFISCPWGYYLEINIVNPPDLLSLGITVPQHKSYILNRSDILDIGKRNIAGFKIN